MTTENSEHANNVALCPAAAVAGVEASSNSPAGGNTPAGGQNSTDASSTSARPAGTSSSAQPVDPTVPAFEGNAKNGDPAMPSATLDPGAKLPQTLASSDGTTANSFNTAAATSGTAADAPALPTGQGAPAAPATGG